MIMRHIRFGLLAAARQSRPCHSTASRRSAIARRLPIATSGTSPTSIRPSTPGARRRNASRRSSRRSAQFKGKLASSPATLADALDTLYAIDKELSRAFVYVGLLADQDTRESGPQGMRQEMVQLGAAFSAEAAYIEPEILKVPTRRRSSKFIAAEPRLKVHRFYLEDIARRAPHTLSDSEERILAAAGPLAGAPSNIYNILSNADFPYPDRRR